MKNKERSLGSDPVLKEDKEETILELKAAQVTRGNNGSDFEGGGGSNEFYDPDGPGRIGGK